jgi:hypothetical protein
MRLSETTFDNAPAPIQRTVEAMISEQPSVTAALSAMTARGMSYEQCKDEITRVVRGCLWERQRGLPLRFDEAFEALGKGRTAAELFPDDLYSPEGPKHS